MLKTFYNWCEEENLPSVTVPTFSEKETVKETYTDSELERLLITPAIKHCHCGHWNHQVLDRVRESGDQSMTGRASGFVTVMS